MVEGVNKLFLSSPLLINKRLRHIICLFCALLLTALPSFGFQFETLQETMASRYGNDGSNLLNAWINMLDSQAHTDDTDKIQVVNLFFNRHINFTDDLLLWRQKDYWATPLETMGVRGGDCEDFTIAKYISLIEMGIPAERLRLIYVRASIQQGNTTRVQAHMVLGYYQTPSSIPLILDNIDPDVKPATLRTDLKPVYSFNRQGLWVGSISQSQADPTSRLSPWRNVLQRMQEEGF